MLPGPTSAPSIAARSRWKQAGIRKGAADAGQKDNFVHVEARPELVIYGDAAEALIQPRISGGTAGDGALISVRPM